MTSNDNPSIRSYSLEQLEQVVSDLGQPKFRAKQLYEWLHSHNASSYDDMTNLPKSMREVLQQEFPLDQSKVLQMVESRDGTRKYLVQLQDGAVVECVGIPDGDDDQRLTVCCSTQVGCAMNCAFCATGMQGLSRNLTADEIVDQVVLVGKDFGTRVSNVVLMGQGEPFQNYDATLAAMRRMNADDGIDIGARHITLSTSGLCDEIKRFADEPEQFRLAISLHSADQAIRNMLMPRLSSQNLKKLHSALEHYCNMKGRRITIEYMMLDGINDTEQGMKKLIEFCEGLNVHVNLLPFNSIDGSEFQPSSPQTVNHWRNMLENAGIPCSIRSSRGSDVAGACGQLIVKEMK